MSRKPECLECGVPVTRKSVICQVCLTKHYVIIRNATINELYQRIKAERDPSLEYMDWDSIEAIFIRLRGEKE